MDDAAVKSCFDDYPDHVRTRLLELRSLILSTAENHHLGAVVESLKWGEPSFSVKTGSPIRIDWKQKIPDSLMPFTSSERHYFISMCFFHNQILY
ncbi:hypothetical protein ACSLBF_04260 [Pseudoalteromonas sp. T1lg65]|uniref:hypothetical protein n=1 Tax=Pseudoalteromonas sp. T1lg65 TaxID=2077101 RepID=UPI003F79355C